MKSAARILVNRLFRVRTQGNFPAIEKGERVLVVSNHESFLDGLVLGLNLPFEATFVVHSQVAAHPIMGRLLNALLQSRGHATVGPGRAIAVQNFFENLGMLTLMGVYLLLEKGDITPIVNGAVIGGMLLLSMSLLYRIRIARERE